MTLEAKDLHVLIIGAGSTGLLIAQGLKKAGVNVSVFEKTTEHHYKDRPRHWSMGLHWGGQYIRKCLTPELAADLRTTETDPFITLTPEQEQAFPFVNGKTGEVCALIKGASSRRVNRAKLRALLSRGLDVQYGKCLMKFNDDGVKITAYFSDGTSTQGDLLIGSDGANSIVRSILVGPEASALTPLHIRICHLGVSYPREQALFIRSMYHPLFKLAPHPDQHTSAIINIVDVPDPEKPETWVFGVILMKWGNPTQPKENATRLAEMKEWMENYCEPFRSAALGLPEDTFIPPDVLGSWSRPVKWDNHGGRVTLAGDAAHPMSPFRGQGLNNALQDAANFVDAIESVLKGEKSLKEAVDTYDDEVFERGKREIRISEEQTYATNHWDVVMDSPIVKAGTHKTEVIEGKL